MGYLRSWVGMLIRVGHSSVLILGFILSHLSMFLLSVHHVIPRDSFLDFFQQVLLPLTYVLKLSFIVAFSIKLYFVYEKNKIYY